MTADGATKPNGYGVLFSTGGATLYAGYWEKGLYSGKGTLYDPEGKLLYEGDFRLGQHHGYGKKYHADGTLQYDGQWENGLYHGEGLLYRGDGTLLYSGSFRNGLYHGQGRLYDDSGTNVIYEGRWENGEMTDETTDKPPDETSGGIPGDTSVEAYEVTIVDETSGEPTGVTIDETSGEPTGEETVRQPRSRR